MARIALYYARVSKQDAANVTDAVYANECLALTYRLPDGWKFQKLLHRRQVNPSSK
jgi:hypothetical protein